MYTSDSNLSLGESKIARLRERGEEAIVNVCQIEMVLFEVDIFCGEGLLLTG